MQETLEPYDQLTINQKINLKGVIGDRRFRRNYINPEDKEFNNALDGIHMVAVLWDWRVAINFFFTQDFSLLKLCGPV